MADPWTPAVSAESLRRLELELAQPAPSGGTGDVWREVIDRLDGWGLRPLRPVCEARRLLGIERYGVPLGRGDGRDGERDLLEELLDGAVYAGRLGRWAMARDLLRMAGAVELGHSWGGPP